MWKPKTNSEKIRSVERFFFPSSTHYKCGLCSRVTEAAINNTWGCNDCEIPGRFQCRKNTKFPRYPSPVFFLLLCLVFVVVYELFYALETK